MSLKVKVILAFLLSVILAYLTRVIIGDWLASNYAYSGPFFWGISSSEYVDGFFFGYVFSSALLFPIFFEKIKFGFYAALPVLVLDLLLGAFNPQLKLDILLLAVGLGLAWLILKLKAYFFPKATLPSNLG